jgi:hypothetical protein
MKQEQIMHRRALGLLLAASALPFTPAFAQDQPTGSDPPPIVDTAPPPVTTTPESTAPAPIATTPPPVIQTAPIVTTPAPTIATETATTPTRRTTRTATTRTVTRQAAPVRATAPAAAAPAATAPLAAQPAPAAEPAPLPAETLPVETLPADTGTTIDTATTADTGRTGLPVWAWLLAGLGLAAILLGLLTRRRRNVVEQDYVREEPVYVEPVRAEAPADFGAEYQAPIVAPAAMAPLAGTIDEGEPQIEFDMRPVRAGVGEDDARVEFELGVTNSGTGTARDVRVSAWMLGANSPARSQAEDALIERVDIGAGEDANVEASVGLPRSGLNEDAIIPVVVAEATFTRPDGSEGRTTASYQVGVPDGAEMIYFDVENPSGLHGGVVAREIDELERA